MIVAVGVGPPGTTWIGTAVSNGIGVKIIGAEVGIGVTVGMGVGVVASMAFECSDREDLVAIDASELFPRVTTWLGFPRDMVLRGYMVDFVHLFAPHYSPRLIRDAARAQSQEEVDELLEAVPLPIKGGCEQELAK